MVVTERVEYDKYYLENGLRLSWKNKLKLDETNETGYYVEPTLLIKRNETIVLIKN